MQGEWQTDSTLLLHRLRHNRRLAPLNEREPTAAAAYSASRVVIITLSQVEQVKETIRAWRLAKYAFVKLGSHGNTNMPSQKMREWESV